MMYGNSKWNKFLSKDFLSEDLNKFTDELKYYLQTQLIPMSSSPVSGYKKNHTKDGEYLTVEVPGFNKSNLTLEIDGTTLTISGKKIHKLNGQENELTLYKSIDIGEVIDMSLIEATVEDGILTVFLPNKNKMKKQRINIQ